MPIGRARPIPRAAALLPPGAALLELLVCLFIAQVLLKIPGLGQAPSGADASPDFSAVKQLLAPAEQTLSERKSLGAAAFPGALSSPRSPAPAVGCFLGGGGSAPSLGQGAAGAALGALALPAFRSPPRAPASAAVGAVFKCTIACF